MDGAGLDPEPPHGAFEHGRLFAHRLRGCRRFFDQGGVLLGRLPP